MELPSIKAKVGKNGTATPLLREYSKWCIPQARAPL